MTLSRIMVVLAVAVLVLAVNVTLGLVGAIHGEPGAPGND